MDANFCSENCLSLFDVEVMVPTFVISNNLKQKRLTLLTTMKMDIVILCCFHPKHATLIHPIFELRPWNAKVVLLPTGHSLSYWSIPELTDVDNHKLKNSKSEDLPGILSINGTNGFSNFRCNSCTELKQKDVGNAIVFLTLHFLIQKFTQPLHKTNHLYLILC